MMYFELLFKPLKFNKKIFIEMHLKMPLFHFIVLFLIYERDLRVHELPLKNDHQ